MNRKSTSIVKPPALACRRTEGRDSGVCSASLIKPGYLRNLQFYIMMLLRLRYGLHKPPKVRKTHPLNLLHTPPPSPPQATPQMGVTPEALGGASGPNGPGREDIHLKIMTLTDSDPPYCLITAETA